MSAKTKPVRASARITKRSTAGAGLRERYWELYLIMAMALGFLLVFKYIPYTSIIIAFQDYNIFKGLFESKFVGLANFHRAFTNPDFYRILRNTGVINFVKTAFYIPLPVVLALLINEVTKNRIKRIVQTTLYLPHFLSWVIVFSAMWKEVGWGTIIHLAAIATVDPQMFEAAVMDGASKLRRIWSITLPTIAGTIVMVALLSLGNILKNSFEQVFVMYNPAVYETAGIINTYVYRYGVGQLEYSYTTAIGLFNGVGPGQDTGFVFPRVLIV